MKHNISITALLVLFFLIAQISGLFVVSEYIDINESNLQGKTVIKNETYENSIGGTPPEVENQSIMWILVITMVLVGTGLVLLIVKFKQYRIWTLWFFFAITMCLANAIIPFLTKIGINKTISIPYLFDMTVVQLTAILIAASLAYLKIFKKNIVIHNLTEILIYGGLVAFLMPLINLTSAIILLIAISIYDMYAVWKSKHMVSMAEFQTEAKMFAGLMLHYTVKEKNIKKSKTVKIKKSETKSAKDIKHHTKDHNLEKSKHSKTKKESEESRTAILGGGDIAFPLIFASAVMGFFGTFLAGLVVIIFSTIALAGLFMYSKKGKYYPAMPFIATGCFIGFGLAHLLF